MPRTSITKLHITGHHQLADVPLDFTHPTTGEPVDRVCFIGSNGTGKSTLLRLLRVHAVVGRDLDAVLPGGCGVASLWRVGEQPWLVVRPRWRTGPSVVARLPRAGADLAALANAADQASLDALLRSSQADLAAPGGPPWFLAGRDLVTAIPAEEHTNDGVLLDGMPPTDLARALQLFKDPEVYASIGDHAVRNMWALLVHRVKQRESDRQEFELRPENLVKTKAQLLREFDEISPPVLTALARLWDDILAQAGLELAVDDARVPVQLNDNLELWVKSRRTGARVSYGALSTGMRRFLFRIGHLFLLYFGRDVTSGLLLVDEPENSLYPDFLFTLMEAYRRVVQRPDGSTSTQSFFATHSPIVAAQFEPHERVVLEWAREGVVGARRGTAPVGDDPNDLLRKDFQLDELMGPAGVQMWQEYLRLRRELRTAATADKPVLLARAAEIAGAYGFEPPRP